MEEGSSVHTYHLSATLYLKIYIYKKNNLKKKLSSKNMQGLHLISFFWLDDEMFCKGGRNCFSSEVKQLFYLCIFIWYSGPFLSLQMLINEEEVGLSLRPCCVFSGQCILIGHVVCLSVLLVWNGRKDVWQIWFVTEVAPRHTLHDLGNYPRTEMQNWMQFTSVDSDLAIIWLTDVHVP